MVILSIHDMCDEVNYRYWKKIGAGGYIFTWDIYLSTSLYMTVFAFDNLFISSKLAPLFTTQKLQCM